MAESLEHMRYVEHMVSYSETVCEDYAKSLMIADLPSYGQRTPKVINGFFPDLYYYDLKCIMIGEAKTTNDLDNEHTIGQLNSYIEEVRTFDCNRHIIICTSIVAFSQLYNMILRKKRKEQLNDITFHILDNHTRCRII